MENRWDFWSRDNQMSIKTSKLRPILTASSICALKMKNDAINELSFGKTKKKLKTHARWQISWSWRPQDWSRGRTSCRRGSRSCRCRCGGRQDFLTLAVAIGHSTFGSEWERRAFTLKECKESVVLAKLKRFCQFRLELRILNEAHQLALVDFHRHHVWANRVIVVGIKNHSFYAAFICEVKAEELRILRRILICGSGESLIPPWVIVLISSSMLDGLERGFVTSSRSLPFWDITKNLFQTNQSGQ